MCCTLCCIKRLHCLLFTMFSKLDVYFFYINLHGDKKEFCIVIRYFCCNTLASIRGCFH